MCASNLHKCTHKYFTSTSKVDLNQVHSKYSKTLCDIIGTSNYKAIIQLHSFQSFQRTWRGTTQTWGKHLHTEGPGSESKLENSCLQLWTISLGKSGFSFYETLKWLLQYIIYTNNSLHISSIIASVFVDNVMTAGSGCIFLICNSIISCLYLLAH